MSETSLAPRPWHYRLLWIIVLFSLLLNVLLLIGLFTARSIAGAEVAKVATSLRDNPMSDLEIPVSIDESLPINMNVPFKDTFTVTISETIPVSTSVLFEEDIAIPIRETVRIDHNVEVFVTILGQRIPIDIPIGANIPIALDINVPVSYEIPVQTNIPINFIVDVPVETEVPINTEVPVQMEFPVTVPMENLEVNIFLQQLQEGLEKLAALLGAGG